MTVLVDGLWVRIKFETREDGGLRVWSDEVPGLVLSGKDPALVLADVEPALRLIIKHSK